jgi:hypothetical protein
MGHKMARPEKKENDGLDKFARYRQRQRRRGMKLLRVWVPDPSKPEFLAEAQRQGLLLRGLPAETEAQDFIEQVFEWPEP